MRRLALFLVAFALGLVATIVAQRALSGAPVLAPPPAFSSLEDALSDHDTPHSVIAALPGILATSPTAGCPSCALTGSDFTDTGDAGVRGNLRVEGDLDVRGDAGIAGNERIGGVLSVQNALQLNGQAIRGSNGVTSQSVAGNDWTIGGDAGVPGSLSVGGAVTVDTPATRNAVLISGAASGTGVTVAATGVDSNVGISINPKGTGSIFLASGNTNFSNAGKVTKYAGANTAGLGVPVILSSTAAAGVSTSTDATSLATTTPTANGVFEVSGNFIVTAYTSGTIAIAASFTDCGGSARSFNINGTNGAGGSANTTNTLASILSLNKIQFCAQSGSAITLKTAITGTATATFWAQISQVN